MRQKKQFFPNNKMSTKAAGLGIRSKYLWESDGVLQQVTHGSALRSVTVARIITVLQFVVLVTAKKCDAGTNIPCEVSAMALCGLKMTGLSKHLPLKTQQFHKKGTMIGFFQGSYFSLLATMLLDLWRAKRYSLCAAKREKIPSSLVLQPKGRHVE